MPNSYPLKSAVNMQIVDGKSLTVSAETPTGTVDGSNKTFVTKNDHVIPSTFSVVIDSGNAVTDDAKGNLSDGGTINYETGEYTVNTAPSTSITNTYDYENANKLSLAFYGDVGDLPDVLIDTPFRSIDDRGNITHIEEDDDSLDFTEFELTCDIVDSQVNAGKHEIEQWFNNHKTVGGTDLISTNKGYAFARKLVDNSLVNVGLKSTYFTLKLEVVFDNSVTGKAFGRAYRYFQPLEAVVSAGQDAQVKLRGRLLGTYEEITALS